MNGSRRDFRLNPAIPFRRYVAKLVDPKYEDEEVYVSRGIILPNIENVRSCSHPKDVILHFDGGRSRLHRRVEQQPSSE